MRVGDTSAETVDIRVLAATNRDLEDEIKAGRFREDLYYRLNVVNLHLPPLRERGDDIVVIARYLLRPLRAASTAARCEGLTPNAIAAIEAPPLAGQHPPAREPHQEGGRAGRQGAARPRGPRADAPTMLPPILPLAEAKEKFQREYINEILELNNGNRTKTARDLGVDPRTIFRHLEKGEGGDDDLPGNGSHESDV